MNPDALAALHGPAGVAALSTAAAIDDPLVAAAALRRHGHPPDLAAAALTQAALRQRATRKFGADAGRMFFTRPGLEQATRAAVATRRAARLVTAGLTRVADLGCGIGADAIAFARAGLTVLAVDADPLTAAVAAANASALGLTDQIEVRTADATTVDLSGFDAVFCDPARRDVTRGRRVFDPTAYSPPWSFVIALAERVPATVLKLAPGIAHELIPAAAEAQWVSVGGDVVEAAMWFGPLATVARRATVLRDGDEDELTGTGSRSAPVDTVRRYVFDPDGAVVRSHLVAEFADLVGGTLADRHIAYVFADEPSRTPLGHCFELLEELPFPVKRLRLALRERSIGGLEIRKRGLAVDPDQLRRDLRLTGPVHRTLILTRIGDTPRALLCRSMADRSTHEPTQSTDEPARPA